MNSPRLTYKHQLPSNYPNRRRQRTNFNENTAPRKQVNTKGDQIYIERTRAILINEKGSLQRSQAGAKVGALDKKKKATQEPRRHNSWSPCTARSRDYIRVVHRELFLVASPRNYRTLVFFLLP